MTRNATLNPETVVALTAMPPPPLPRWLTTDGAAAYSTMSRNSIRRMIEMGALRAHRPRPGRILIDRHELDAAIQASADGPRSGRGRPPQR
jgi:excisionase family DNA binding protein